MVISAPAGTAFAADKLRPGRCQYPRFNVFYTFADRFYNTRVLMALHDRVRCERVFAVINVDIAATYAYPLNPQQNLSGTCLWFLNFAKLNFSRFSHDSLSHLLFFP
jgi:hypothetical protein